MKIGQKRTCVACRALKNHGGAQWYCELGYKVRIVDVSDWFSRPTPTEPCPKPTTYDQLFRAEKQFRRVGR